MDLPGPSNSTSDVTLCQLCNSNPPKYTCPRCSVAYCSVQCYKGLSHLDCSEEFYKQCVQDEIKARSSDPDDRQKMVDILKRFHQESSEFDYLFEDEEINDMRNSDEMDDASGDSDDDNEVPDLSERIKNINMDNADELWAALTNAEQQEFEAILRNGDVEKILPPWVPWWTLEVNHKLVKELDEHIEIPEYKKNCPTIVSIPPLAALDKASPLVANNLLNILCAYVLMTLHYNGEHISSSKEAVDLFLQLNDVIGSTKVFENAESAIESVHKKSIDYGMLDDESDAKEIKESINKIIRGPKKGQQSYYLSAALSDLHSLFNKVSEKNCATEQKNTSNKFPNRLKSNFKSTFSKLSKRNLNLYIKKLEYFLAWINKYGSSMAELDLDEFKLVKI